MMEIMFACRNQRFRKCVWTWVRECLGDCGKKIRNNVNMILSISNDEEKEAGNHGGI